MTDINDQPPVRLLDFMEGEFAALRHAIERLENRLRPIDCHLSGFFLDRDYQNEALRLLKSQVDALQDQIRHLKGE